jgi:DNA-binding ferritin-like protein (Dps family)
MDDKIVLICATGRSGSTTMQRIINTIPNSNICGENFGAINSLLEFYRRIKNSSIKNIPGHFNPASYAEIVKQNIKPSWYNSYNYQQIVQMIKITIINMFKNKTTTNVWGFKEIRYDSGNINYIKDFKELFPQTKVIIHIRENILAQSQSGWFKNDKNAVPFLNKTTKELIQFYKGNKDYCYLTSFEKMFDINILKKVFQFIECGEKFNEKIISEILKNNLKD